MNIHISDKPFDPWQIVQDYQDRHLKGGSYGALSLFVGTMRDFNAGSDIKAMEIEHYQGMAEKSLSDTVTKLMGAHKVEDVLVIHRIGTVYPGDPIVAVAVWSAHRGDAYTVNRAIVESLKSDVPFWKKETFTEQDRQDHQDRWVGAQDERRAN